MLKKEFYKSFADRFGYTYTTSRVLIEEVFNHLRDCIIKEGEVSIMGFGTFNLNDVPEIKRYSFADGKPVINKPTKRVTFKAGYTFKKAAKNGDLIQYDTDEKETQEE